MTPKNILFLCPDNAVSSIMAEAYLATAGRSLARAFSAGPRPAAAVHPLTVETLKSAGIRCGGLAPKSWQSFALSGSPRMDLVVALADLDEFGPPPVWPGTPPTATWRVGGGDTLMTRRRGGFVELLGEIRMLVDTLLLEMPGVGQVRMPEVA